MKKKVYMIGNAHLDPVWVWRWQEGSAETKATIRSALDRMNEEQDFLFVCSSVFVYECIEEFDSAMFDQIRQRVKEGRFIIVGGWYVQPDCNLPSGEGFARQSLYGQRYFKEKFGVTAKVGYNVDSFGHNAMLPQILKKSGMDSYIFLRPCETEKHMDSNLFEWVAPDGSAVTAFRICDNYVHNYTDLDDFKEHLKKVSDEKLDCTDYAMAFYGVGNHGGGPTKHNIQLIKQYQAEKNECQAVFGNPSEFFDAVRSENRTLPKYKGDLQHHASGCYSAVSKIKNALRRCESNVVASEIYSVEAGVLLGKKYPAEELKKAWKNILFIHFHDAIGGCCIAPVYDDLNDFAGETLAVAQKTTNNALQSLSWAIDTSDSSKGIPVVVFNPNPWAYDGLVKINNQANSVYDNIGNPVPIQHVFSPAHNVYRRDDTVFLCSIPAYGYRVYYIKEEQATENKSLVCADENCLENSQLKVVFDKENGYITSVYDKLLEKELISGNGAVPVVIDENEHDTWSHAMNYFDKRVGEFRDAEITVTENGPLRGTVKVTSRYNDSVLKQYFSLSADSQVLEVSAEIDWQEKNKMLKLSFEMNIDSPTAYYEIPFGYISRPCNGEEESGQRWIAMCGNNGSAAVINNNKYSSSFNDSVMNLTVIRSPLFCDHGGPRFEESEYTDIGRHKFKYSFMPVRKNDFCDVIREAGRLNTELDCVIENNHSGSLPEVFSGIEIDGEGIVVSALKRSEDGKGTVLRAYEALGKTVCATFSGGLLREPLHAEFTAHSVKTFLLPDESTVWREVMITEFDYDQAKR